MLANKTTNSNSNNNNNNNSHRRQLSGGIGLTDRSSRSYRDDDRQLIQYLVNEYLLEGSHDVLDLIRNCPNECFEALLDFIWNPTSQSADSNEDDLSIYGQRSSLLSPLPTNAHRQGARSRLAIIFIEVFKLLATPTITGGRSDLQRQTRLLVFPAQVRQLIDYEPDIHGLSCLTLSSITLINPNLIHHQLALVIDVLKHAANQFVQANLSFDTPSTLALSIYSLFYLLYILYPNNLRRELQPDSTPTINSNEKLANRLGIEKVLLPLCYHFKLQPSIVCGTAESEKHESRWQNDSWQHLLANGDRYVASDDLSSLLPNDFRKRKEEESKKNDDSNRFEIDQIVRMCNKYTESVLNPSETKSQIVKSTIESQYGKKHSTDCYSNYSDSHCQTYEQQWQTTIQNGQMNLSRIQAPDESNRRQHTNGTSTKTDSKSVDHNIYAKVQLQLDMLDCNYEQDKREYYAQLIRDVRKAKPIHELEKEIKSQEMRYEELINARQQKCPDIHTVRDRINEFHRLNETFYNSLSATQVELKTDEDEHWQQRSLNNETYMRLQNEKKQLEQAKASIENDIRDIQRRLFQSKQDAKQSIDLRDSIDKLHIDLVCTRKKHQLLHNALLNVKLKATNAEKLLVMHQNEEREQTITTTLDEKKAKFEEYKHLLDKQQTDLTAKRNSFNEKRNMNTHKISVIRRQMDSIRICQTQLHTMNINSQIVRK
ncbi:unnamed protein product [Adineta ricciae]|uniref:Uncharacterized protein n=1 Tax=Adineta ricciae TaxID=249248 RepID=A0A813VG01_ADIRI|nr:unnamed protein product [Adineta ricciae]